MKTSESPWTPTGNIVISKGFIQVYEKEFDCGWKGLGFDASTLANRIQIEQQQTITDEDGRVQVNTRLISPEVK